MFAELNAAQLFKVWMDINTEAFTFSIEHPNTSIKTLNYRIKEALRIIKILTNRGEKNIAAEIQKVLQAYQDCENDYNLTRVAFFDLEKKLDELDKATNHEKNQYDIHNLKATQALAQETFKTYAKDHFDEITFSKNEANANFEAFKNAVNQYPEAAEVLSNFGQAKNQASKPRPW